MKTLRTIPELRGLFSAARRYLRGELSICELNGLVGQLKALARFGQVDGRIVDLLHDWDRMVNRHWNEWNLEADPLTEAQFCEWLALQLVFDY
jgi:hypothetical protein